MKNCLKIFVSFCLVLSIFLLSACFVGQIEDTNGADDTSLCKLTNRDLTAKRYHYTSVGRVISDTESGVVYRVSTSFSGVDAVYGFSLSDGESMTLAVSSELTGGNFRLFLWSDGRIVEDIPVGIGKTVTVSAAGKYEVRAAGESAVFRITLQAMYAA